MLSGPLNNMAKFQRDDIAIAYDVAGSGPPLLLLHGFPQTRALWRRLVPRLARQFTVVTSDLRGYGDSSKPDPGVDCENYAFRSMADDQRALMAHLGYKSFHLAGHDRGGRVAYRMARDTPDCVQSLAVMDIVPTDHLVDTWDYPVAKAYFHWTYLAQPAPFPERMIQHDPDHFYEACLLGWGGASLEDFPDIDAYRKAWRNPAAIAAMAHDYRAGVKIDVLHDRQSEGDRLDCPALVLFGADGVMAKFYDIDAIWKTRLPNAQVTPMPGGHFFVDQHPANTADALLEFLIAL